MGQAVLVVGAGAWGTAVANHLARHPAGHRVQLWARRAEAAAELTHHRTNARYLPGVVLDERLGFAHGDAPAVAEAARGVDWVVLASPVASLRAHLAALAQGSTPAVWLCKGLEAETGLMPHEVCAQVAPQRVPAVLSGPSFALEVARGQPTALVAASPDVATCEALVDLVHGPSLRVYGNADIAGVELGGALKNVLAIAAGVLDGLAEGATDPAGQPGLNARAALITRGLAEMARLGRALGAQDATFMGLGGLGDLVLTATGGLSRNRQVGLLLAQGLDAQAAMLRLGHVAEGVLCARAVAQRAASLGVDLPITQAVLALLDGQLTAAEAAAQLMGRSPRPEA